MTNLYCPTCRNSLEQRDVGFTHHNWIDFCPKCRQEVTNGVTEMELFNPYGADFKAAVELEPITNEDIDALIATLNGTIDKDTVVGIDLGGLSYTAVNEIDPDDSYTPDDLA